MIQLHVKRVWWWVLAAVVVLGVGLRSFNFTDDQILDFHAWRQADSAAFTHGYLVDTLHPFYPSIDRYPCRHKGEPFGRVEAEFPVVAWLAALPLAALGVDYPPAPYLRAVSILFYVLTCLYLFLLVLRLGGEEGEATTAVAAFSLMPLSIFFTRTIQPDGPALFLGTAFLYHLLLWLEDDRWRDGVLSAAFGALVMLLKISNGFLLFPSIYLFVTRKGLVESLKTPKYWVWGFAILLPVAAWYWHARQFGWSFGVWGDRGASKFTNLDVFTDPGIWRLFSRRLTFDILTWAGVILSVIGFSRIRQREAIRFAAVWAAAVLFFVLISLRGNQRHVYYQLPFVLPLAISVGVGICALWRRRLEGRATLVVLTAIYALTAYHTLFGAANDWGNGYFHDDVSARVQDGANLVREHLDDGEVFVASVRHPAIFYNSTHRGWFYAGNNMKTLASCADEDSPYLLLSPRDTKRFKKKRSVRGDFEQIAEGKWYTLWKRKAPTP